MDQAHSFTTSWKHTKHADASLFSRTAQKF